VGIIKIQEDNEMAAIIRSIWKKRALRYALIALALCLSVATAYAVSVPYTFVSGETASASQVNANFDYLETRSWDHNGDGLVYDGALVEIIGDTVTAGELNVTSYRNSSAGGLFYGRKARGSMASPSVPLLDDALAVFGGEGYDSTAFTTVRGRMSVRAAETWSDTNNGTYISFETTPIGSTTRSEVMRIGDSGKVQINGDGVTGKLQNTTYSDVKIGGGFTGRKARGTAASPSAVLLNDNLASFMGEGYNSVDFTSLSGRMAIKAAENWTTTNNGTYIMFETTPKGSTYRDEVMRIDDAGNVGIGVITITHPLEMFSGAHVTSGGVWTDASSREFKENIANLKPEKAMEALRKLEPVTYTYKKNKTEKYVGFIAEDVPELVATKDRKGLAPMDIVAVLTKVVQEQQKTIEELKREVAEIKASK
jgi:hypothetical protein